MNGKQRSAAQRCGAQVESAEYAKDMGAFVNEGVGSLLVGKDEPASVPDPVPSATTADSEERAEQATIVSKDLIVYPTTEESIAELAKQFSGLGFGTPTEYESGRKAIATCRDLRGAIDETRKKLIRDPIDRQRLINATAGHLTELIEEIENPLIAAKAVVDEAKAKARREKEEAEKAALEAEARAKLEAEATAARLKREAEQAELDRQRAALEVEKAELARQRAEAEARDRAEREVREATERAEKAKRDAATRIESERVAAAQKVESDRLAAIAAEQAAERERLAAESRKLKQAQEFAERQEFERTTKLRLEAEAKAQAERNRVSAEKEQAAAEARRIAEQARVEALRPDTAKLRAFATALRAVPRPALKAVEAQAMLEQVESVLEDATLALEAFGGEIKEAASAAE